MEVIHVCPLFLPHLGGVETHVKEISTRLIKLGLNITVYTTDRYDSNGMESVEGIKVMRFKSLSPDGLYLLSQKLFRKLIKTDADVIHLHGYPEFPSLVALLNKSYGKKPIVLTPHKGEYTIATSMWRTIFKNYFNVLLGRHIFNAVDAVVAVSHYDKEALMRVFGIDGTKIRYIPNGSSAPKLPGVAPKKKSAVKTLLYVGRLEKYKGIHIILQTFYRIKKLFPNTKLVIVGKGPYKKQLKSLANRLQLQNEIKFLEGLSNEELASIYLSSDLFITLPKYEAFGITIVDAMAYGLPVIATKVGGIPEIVQPNKTGFLLDYPPDVDKLTKMVKFLLENPEFLEEMGKRARDGVLSRYSWDKAAQSLLALYQEISE